MKELITTITIGSLSLSLLTMLIPKKEKAVKYVVSVVFLCMLIIPIFSAIPKLKTENIKVENVSVKENVLNLKIKTTELLVEEILKRNNLEFNKITVYANISDDFSITIKRVEIISNEKAESLLSALKELDFEKVVKSYEG